MPPSIGRIAPYFVRANWVDGTRIKTYEYIETIQCAEELLKSTGGDDNVRLQDQYENLLCLSKQTDLNIELKGLYYAQEFNYIETRLELCPQYGGDDCATVQEIEDFFTNNKYTLNTAFKE